MAEEVGWVDRYFNVKYSDFDREITFTCQACPENPYVHRAPRQDFADSPEQAAYVALRSHLRRAHVVLVQSESLEEGEARLTRVDSGSEPRGALAEAGAKEPYEWVDHPQHYGGADDPYEAIKVMEAWNLCPHLWETLRYLSRAGKKPGQADVRDLKKARWYLDRHITQLEDGTHHG